MNISLERFQNAISLKKVEVMSAFANAIEARDEYTKWHSSRVADFSCKIAMRLGLPWKTVEILNAAALLHDVGKIGMPGHILEKKAPLTAEEYTIVKQHPLIGAAILRPIREFKALIPIIYHHHERFDGKGYPEGLKGEEIPLLSRIISVADSFEAMTSDRCYRNRLSFQEALEELQGNSAAQFDPAVTDAFMELVATGEVGGDLSGSSSWKR